MIVVNFWVGKTSSLYAIVREGVHLPEAYLSMLQAKNPKVAQQVTKFIQKLVNEVVIRPVMLRDELPKLGIYAMHNYSEAKEIGYCPSRLLCAYPHQSANRILLVGNGAVKDEDRSIQDWPELLSEAKELAVVKDLITQRIDSGEVKVVGNRLVGKHQDSLEFE